MRVELTILDALDEYVWRLVYSSIRTVLTGFPSEDPLFARGTGGFDDLGYHKLTEADDGFLRPELLFRSGAILGIRVQRYRVILEVLRGYVTLNQRPPFLFEETPFPASSPTTTVIETPPYRVVGNRQVSPAERSR